MRVLVVDVDSMIPNLALHKIVAYHKSRGDKIWQMKDKKTSMPMPLFIRDFGKIYISCVFSWNKERCKKWEGIADIGGSGYSLDTELPPEIEVMKPKINLGFVTRGCIRKCFFCVVPRKEGKIRQVADIYDIWDGKAKGVTLLDNNILALPKVFFETCKQIKKENLQVDFNQGLDHRLLTDQICQELFSLRIKPEAGSKLRFAYDDVSYKPTVLKALEMLKRNGMKDWNTRWYVYVGLKDTVETILERVNLLRDWHQTAFVMLDRDERVFGRKDFKSIRVWCAAVWHFARVPFSEFEINHLQNTRSRQGLLANS